MKHKLVLVLLVSSLAFVWGAEVMGWMCLERCKENIKADLQQITQHKHVLTAVSFEAFDLGANGTLVNNSFSNVNEQLQKLGLKTFPMITTVNLDKLRQLFQNPTKFIQQAISIAKSQDYTGYNIDFEPTTAATAQDAQAYAAFLTAFQSQLTKNGLRLGVDIASWNTFWSFPDLAKSSVDSIITMDTYAGHLDTFTKDLQKAVSFFPLNRLGIGLETVNPNTNQPFSQEELQDRFNLIKQSKIQEVDLWMFPIPDAMWPFLKAFRDGAL